MTVPAQVIPDADRVTDEALESLMDGEVVCAHPHPEPATHAAVHIACGNTTHLCRRHLDEGLHLLAAGRAFACLGCDVFPLTRTDFSIRPI